MKYIKKMPLPIAAVALALAALGNLLMTYSTVARTILGSIAAIVLGLLTIKIIVCWENVKKEFNNPVIASVVPTYSMALMLLSGYLKPIAYMPALALFWIGLIIHLVLMILYTTKYIIKFNIKKVFTSIFIVYVGIGVGGITAPAFGLASLGKVIFWFALISLLVLLVLVAYRVWVIKEVPEPAFPTTVIFAAPAALTLAAYLNSFESKNLNMVYFLAILVGVLYIVGLVYLIKGLKLKFYPSYAAFTFPLVISAIALKGTNGLLIKMGKGISWLKYVVNVQEIIATIIVLYVCVRFVMFIFKDDSKIKVATSSINK